MIGLHHLKVFQIFDGRVQRHDVLLFELLDGFRDERLRNYLAHAANGLDALVGLPGLGVDVLLQEVHELVPDRHPLAALFQLLHRFKESEGHEKHSCQQA
jgi:hypothetical protein